MRPNISGPAGRLAPAVGTAAAIWLAALATTSGADTLPRLGAAFTAPEHGRVHLAQANAGPTERPVSFAMDQADRGEERFAKDCEECHGEDLKGGLNGGPPLRGLAFEEMYTDGLPASLLFAYMSSEMPPNAPGRYPPNMYADVMAYILKRNGFQPGAPLPSDIDALGYLIMDK